MKKKVIFVTNNFEYLNGVAMALRSVIENINSQKYDVSLLAVYRFDKDFAKTIIDKVQIVPGFGFYFRGFDRIINLLPLRILYKWFIKDYYDLKISFQYGIPTKMLAVSAGNKICWMHGYDTGLKLRKYYNHFDKVITVSKVGCKKMINDGFPKEKTDYCYNIIDENIIEHKRKERCELTKSKNRIVITVGRLDPDKAHMRFCECIKEVRNQLNGIEFWIVGGGKEESKLRNFIINNKLQNIIKMTGQQTNPFPYMNQADVYYCCSYKEGFSTTCQEAAIMGLPVVTVAVDGADELIEEAGCGKVVRNDKAGIRQSLIDLTNSDEIESWQAIAKLTKVKFYKAERIKKLEKILDEA